MDAKHNVHFNVTNTALAQLRRHAYDDMTDEQKLDFWAVWLAWRKFEESVFPHLKRIADDSATVLAHDSDN